MVESTVLQELSDLRMGTEAYAEQVSRDFEESTWLRRLLEQFDSSDAASPLVQIAGQVLPGPRPMIWAEAVVLLASRASGTAARTEPHSRVLSIVGSSLVDDGAYEDLAARLTRDVLEYPVIRNQIPSGTLPAGCDAIHSCIVVPVTR